MPKLTVLASYGGVFAVIMSIIAVGYQPPQQTAFNSAVVDSTTQSPTISPEVKDAPSVDEIVATDVASNLAEQTNMPVATNVANLSVSLAAKTELAQTSETAIVKPQILQATESSRDIITYVAKQGDTVQSIAANHGVSTDTVRWANNLVADTVTVGRSLTIPPIDGVVYTVKAGDTPDSVAKAYSASKDRIVAFNDLEISGMQPGSRIVIPGGNLPENQRPGYQAPISQSSSLTSSYDGSSGYRVNSGINGASAGNKYAWGNCTWYVFERRQQMGRPVGSFWGNAKTWSYYARMDGYLVTDRPSVGAIFVDQTGYYGHVGVVESMMPNGDIVVSEMNNAAYGGFNIVNRRTITAGQATAFQYIK